MGGNVSLSFQAVKGGVHGANGYLTVNSKFDLLTHGDPVGAICQAQEGQDNDVLEFAEEVAVTHYLYNIEEICGCQKLDGQIQDGTRAIVLNAVDHRRARIKVTSICVANYIHVIV